MRKLSVRSETFDLKRPFAISRGSIDAVTVLVVEIEEGPHKGRGESVPSTSKMISRQEGVLIAEQACQQVLAVRKEIENGAGREELADLIKDAPARNAVDYALWDLEAKIAGKSVWGLLGITPPEYFDIAYTYSLDETPGDNKGSADENYRLLKIKLGDENDLERVTAIHNKMPNADIIVDVNCGWSVETLKKMAFELKDLGVKLIEQPVPPENDLDLLGFESPIPLCADESCRDRSDLPTVAKCYDYINIKLDKSGGLTEGLYLAEEARKQGLGIMVGCMAGTSLSMTAALPIAYQSSFIDLDGPLLLKDDRDEGLVYDGGRLILP